MKYLTLLMVSLMMTVAQAQHFRTGSHVVTNELKEELFKFYKDKLEGQEIESLIVEGHTDVRGSDSYNQALSEKRAKAALAELRRLGFKDNSTVKGLGESKPISSVHGENRRIVLRIGDDVTVIAECKPKRVEVPRKMLKNTIRLLGGVGPTGLSVEKKGTTAKVTEDDGVVFGLGYSRRFSERISSEINVLNNETYLLGVGFHF